MHPRDQKASSKTTSPVHSCHPFILWPTQSEKISISGKSFQTRYQQASGVEAGGLLSAARGGEPSDSFLVRFFQGHIGIEFFDFDRLGSKNRAKGKKAWDEKKESFHEALMNLQIVASDGEEFRLLLVQGGIPEKLSRTFLPFSYSCPNPTDFSTKDSLHF